MEQDVRVAPDGVFVAATKVADLQQILERITRDDILAIGVPASPSRPVKVSVVRGALIGAGAGLVAGLVVPGDGSEAPTAGAAFGGIGAGIGAAIGFATREQVREVIYRAP